MKPYENMVGRVFGWLLVVDEVHVDGKFLRKCVCRCGNTTFVMRYNLLNGKSKSCGCLRNAGSRDGLTDTRTGQSWESMLNRCYRKTNDNYPRYGGRGIVVCEHLRKSPASLIEFIGERPDGSTLDRPDNNGNYSCGECQECKSNKWPLNVRWAGVYEQSANKSNNRIVTINGVSKHEFAWAREYGINPITFSTRLREWGECDRLLSPVQKKRNKSYENARI